MSSIMKGLQNEETDFEVNVPGYGTMPLEMLKRHVKALANDFNEMVQSEEFIKAAYRTEQFYNALMALAKAMKAKSKDLDETHSTGTSVGSAGIGGGAGLGIDKSPIEKVIEKPLGESLPTSPGGMGQSYRKFTPKSAGVAEEQAPMFTPEEKIVNMNDKKSDGWRVYKAKPAGSKDEVDEVSNFLALRQKDDEFKKIFGTTPLYKEGDSIVTKFSDKTPNIKGVVIDFDPKTKKTLIKTDDGKKYFVHAQNLSKINKESSIMKGLQTEVNTHGSSKGK